MQSVGLAKRVRIRCIRTFVRGKTFALVNDEKRGWLRVHDRELYARKASAGTWFRDSERHAPEMFGLHSLELFCFIQNRLTRVHCLHSKDLVVGLLVIVHRGREVVESLSI